MRVSADGGATSQPMSSDPRTRTYVERRSAEGRSKPEIMRVLKRYVAREVYRHLPACSAPEMMMIDG